MDPAVTSAERPDHPHPSENGERPENGARAAALWALAALAASASVAGLEPSLLEEGLQLHTAERLAQGDRMFRDIASFTGPLPFELLGVLFRIFGSEIWVARAAIAALHALACVCTFLLVRGVRPRAAHFAAAVVVAEPVLLFPLVSWYWYTTVCLHLCALTALLATRGLRDPRAAFAAGASVAGVALCKQTVGAALALTLLACLAGLSERRGRQSGAYIAGGALTTLAVLAFYGVRGDLFAMFDQMVTWPLNFKSTFSVPFPNFWPPGRFSPELPNPAFYLPSLYTVRHGGFVDPNFALTLFTQSLFALPFASLLAVPLLAWRYSIAPAVWIQAAVLISFTTHMWPRSDWGHICYVIPISLVLITLMLPLPERFGRWLGTGLTGTLLAGSAAAALWLHSLVGEMDFGPRVPLAAVSQASRQVLVPKAIAYLREHVEPGEPIFVARSEPLLYFATGTSNPTPYVGVVPGFKEIQQQVILEGLEKVRYVAMSDIDQPLYLYYRDELPEVQYYLERHFRVVRRIPPGWLSLLERAPDLGETHEDLLLRATEGRYWVREPGGQRILRSPELPVLVTVQNQRPLAFPLGSLGGGVDFEIQLPHGPSQFQGSVGIRQIFGAKQLYQHPARARAVVSIRSEGSDRFEPLASREIAITDKRGWRWIPLATSLRQWQGQRIWLRLELISSEPIERAFRHGWFGSPRIARPPLRPAAPNAAGPATPPSANATANRGHSGGSPNPRAESRN